MDNKEQKKTEEYRWLPEFLKAFAEMSGWVAIPVISALFFGQWLDSKFQTGQIYFLTLTGAAFILSCIGLGKTALRYLRKAEKSNNKKLNKENDIKQNGQ